MGIFGAMLTAVSGLRAQSYSLENISGNIANSQTTGFKRVDTSFVDLIPDMPYRKEVAGSVAAFSRLTNTIQGDMQATGISTNIALNGEGMFVVAPQESPVKNLYTRRGDFTLSKDGRLVNGAGFAMKGTSINPVTGARTNGVVQINTEPLPARRTAEIQYKANLPNMPGTADARAGLSNLLGAPTLPPPAVAPPDYRVTALPAVVPGPAVTTAAQPQFLNQTIDGGSLVVYNDVGAAVDVQLRWGKVSNAPGAETWNLFYLENAAGSTWRNAGTPVTFASNGELTSGASIPINNLNVNGTLVGNVSINWGGTGLTQYATQDGLAEASLIQQDGFPSGVLESLQVTSDGRIVGSYSNGQIAEVASVQIAQFRADNALKRLDGGVYEQTLESGEPAFGLNGATLIGGNVENSNTDIAEEFSKMIITQQAYSANTRVVSTSQQMLSDVINMVR
jgi:flagellar hook protein FlgE